MRALWPALALVLVLAGTAQAEEEAVSGNVKGEMRALSGEARTLDGEARALGGELRNLEGLVLALTGPVVDVGGKAVALQVKETKTEIRIELEADVLFEFDKADLKPEAQATLKKAADFLREQGGKGVVTIEGHTDGKGNDAYNQKLSERRAQSVRDYFVKSEKLGGSFSVKGFGKTKPLVPNQKADGSDDPAGRQKNRRVEIVVRKA